MRYEIGDLRHLSRLIPEIIIARVTSTPVRDEDKGDHALVAEGGVCGTATGYAAFLCRDRLTEASPAVHSVALDHLNDGDVIAVDGRGYIRTLYRRDSPHNSIFATDHCNSLCLMCSQPPRDVDEATLLGEGLVRMIGECKERLPETSLHILSNGRLFSNDRFAQNIADVDHPDLMIGIPLYSDIDSEHDYVVQSRGAFAETMRGLHNLGRLGVPVEIRVVIHRLTYERLPQLAEFLYRNVTFASQVALMGLEITGYTVPNLELLWLDPWDSLGVFEFRFPLDPPGMSVSRALAHRLLSEENDRDGNVTKAALKWRTRLISDHDRASRSTTSSRWTVASGPCRRAR
jgi:hypothetical protein